MRIQALLAVKNTDVDDTDKTNKSYHVFPESAFNNEKYFERQKFLELLQRSKKKILLIASNKTTGAG